MANSPLKIIGIVASATIGVASAAYGAQKIIVNSLAGTEVDFEFRAKEQFEIVTRDGAKIAVYRDGPAHPQGPKLLEGNGRPTLLFLHGYALCAPIWAYQFDLLRDEYDLVAIDLRGHGASTVGENGINLSAYADDIYDVIDHLKLKEIVLMGHSTGGVVALSYLEKYKNDADKRIVGMCLISTLAEPPQHHRANMTEALTKFTFVGKTLQALSDVPIIGFPMARFAMGRKASNSVVEFVRRAIAATDPDVATKLLQMLLNFSFIEELERFKEPSCVIVGTSDPITPVSDAVIVAELLGGEVDIIEGVGHLPMLESPDEFNEIISNFLNKYFQNTDAKT